MLSRRQKSVLLLVPFVVAFFYLVSTSTQPTALRETWDRYRPNSGSLPPVKEGIEDGPQNDNEPEATTSDDMSGIDDGLDEDEPQGDINEPWRIPDTGLLETTQPVPATNGFNVFDNLYVWNKTIFIVTHDAFKFLPREHIVSRPVTLDKDRSDTAPRDEDIQFIAPQAAEELFAATPAPIPGASVILHDKDNFLRHFYHWWGELILGSWRVYSALAHDRESLDALPLPERFILPFVADNEWRDPANVDGPLMRAAFPTAPIEHSDYWTDLAALGRPVVFQRAVLANRIAAHTHPKANEWHKMIASTMLVDAPEGFFEPVRKNVVKAFWGSAFINLEEGQTDETRMPPLVTYISRQAGRRRLSDRAHEDLVEELHVLAREGACRVEVVHMETLGLRDQVAIAARSTILLGVHGNGLTHQLWMPPSQRSAVVEMMVPGAYVYDYEMLARNMGHKHYAVTNDTYLTYEKGRTHKGISWGDEETFQGNAIPVHAPTVIEVIRRQLAIPIKPS